MTNKIRIIKIKDLLERGKTRWNATLLFSRLQEPPFYGKESNWQIARSAVVTPITCQRSSDLSDCKQACKYWTLYHLFPRIFWQVDSCGRVESPWSHSTNRERNPRIFELSQSQISSPDLSIFRPLPPLKAPNGWESARDRHALWVRQASPNASYW